MAKRFIDTDIFKKQFIRGLSAKYKLLWLYILNDCNHAGVWECDFEVASLRIGESVTESEAISAFGGKIIQIDNNTKWFIPSFIEFQYGSQLSKTNNIFKNVDVFLKKYDLYKFLTVEISETGTTISAQRNRVSQKVRDKIFLEAEFICQYCSEQKQKIELVVDHFIPLFKGGTSDDNNLVCCCVRCNSHKTDIMPDVFLEKRFAWLNPTNKLKALINSLKPPYKKLKPGKEKDIEMEEVNEKEMEQEKNFQVEEIKIESIEVEVWPTWKDFWDEYDKKKGSPEKLKPKWLKLRQDEREAIMEYLPNYKIAQPDKQYRLNPETFLNNKSWNDELIFKNGKQTSNHTNKSVSIAAAAIQEARRMSGNG